MSKASETLAGRVQPAEWRRERPAPEKFTAGPSGIKPDPVAEVDYSRAKVTVCPAPAFTHRYQAQRGEPVIGGFSAAGVGRYLSEASS